MVQKVLFLNHRHTLCPRNAIDYISIMRFSEDGTNAMLWHCVRHDISHGTEALASVALGTIMHMGAYVIDCVAQ